MLVKKITYTDYNGVTRSEPFYFNLSKAELMEMELTTTGGMEQLLTQMIETKDNKRLFEFFKQIVLKSYGEKSADGKRFIKSPELSEAFSQTEAYTELLFELMESTDSVVAFVNGIMPVDLTPDQVAEVMGQIGEQTATPSLVK